MIRNILKIGKKVRISLLMGTLAIFSNFSLSAQSESEIRYTDTIVLKVQFRQGIRYIDKDYMSNQISLQHFTATMQKYTEEMKGRVESVTIVGGASVEGSARLNRDLSNNRARRMVEILSQFLDVPDEKVTIDSRGVNWEDVADMVEKDPLVPSKDRVLDILRNVPEARRKTALEVLDEGRPYNYMYKSIFPYVRTGKMTVVLSGIPKHPSPADTVWMTKTDTLYVETPVDVAALPVPCADNVYIEKKEYLFAFRSNLLLPLMNVGMEFPMSKHWSYEIDWHYPWLWPAKANKDCFEILSLTTGFRLWMRKPRDERWRGKTDLTGPSLGLNAMVGYYDFEKDYKGRQGEFAGAQLDFTYGTQLGKSSLRMEFTVGGGYVYTQSRTYHVRYEGGLLLRDNHVEYVNHWFGPTKLGITLVIPISRKVKVPMSRDEYLERYGPISAESLIRESMEAE